MNVFEKLNEARTQFQNCNKKMSGKNSFAGYSYYELADILPEVNRICGGLKVTCVVRYEKELAYLDFIDCEKPQDKITFTSPMSEANLKGCHAVQNLGAVETYIKRYLYQACFEIVENDALDATMNPNQTQPKPKPQQPQKPQLKGGDSTPAEKAEMMNLLQSKGADGLPVFSKDDMRRFSDMRHNYTAAEVIGFIKNELSQRLSLPQQAQMVADVMGGAVQNDQQEIY